MALVFDPQYAEYIFGLFKRLQTKHPGTGLGLVICRRILERPGARIWAESTPGSGSNFIFSLPRGVQRKIIVLAALAGTNLSR